MNVISDDKLCAHTAKIVRNGFVLFVRVIFTETFYRFPVYCVPGNLKLFHFPRSPNMCFNGIEIDW